MNANSTDAAERSQPAGPERPAGTLVELATLDRWVPYRKRQKDSGNFDKVPSVGVSDLSTADSEHRFKLAEAQAIAVKKRLAGVGLVFTNGIEIAGHRLVGFDFDKVTPDFKPPIRGYAEWSPSKNGVRQFAWVQAALLDGKKDNGQATFANCDHCEIYIGSTARFLTVTFDVINDDGIAILDAEEFKQLVKLLPADPPPLELPEIEDGEPIDLSRFQWNADQQALRDGTLPEGERSELAFGMLVTLLNEHSPADVIATVISVPGLWGYYLSKRRDDPERAMQLLRDDVVRATAKALPWGNFGKLADVQRQRAANDEAPKKAERGHGIKLKTLAEVVAGAGPINWLIKDFLEASTLAVAYGEPASYKTFLAIAVAVAVASGHDFYGRKVARKGPVVFIFGEGWNNAGRRFKAICLEWALDPATLPIVFSGVIGLTVDESVAALQAAVAELPEPPVLFIIDTLARNFGPGDENSTKDMTKAIASADALRGDDATVLVIHHTGKDAKGGMRGSSALPGATDARYYVEHEPSTKTVAIINEKMKDAEKPQPLKLAPKVVELPFKDGDGVVATSVVLEPAAMQGMVRLAEFYKEYPTLVSSKERRERLGPVFQRISEQPDISINGLAKAIGIAPATADGFAKALREAGLVEQDGLRLTTKGQQIAALVLDPSVYSDRSEYPAIRNAPNRGRMASGKGRG